MIKLRDILRPEAERRAEVHDALRPSSLSDLSPPEWLIEGTIQALEMDLDANCRALAVALGLWSTPWPEGESAPRLEVEVAEGVVYWNLIGAEGSGLERWCARDIPGLDAFTSQSDAMPALRCIWAALDGGGS